jgi:hypothetical protein
MYRDIAAREYAMGADLQVDAVCLKAVSAQVVRENLDTWEVFLAGIVTMLMAFPVCGEQALGQKCGAVAE